MKVRRQTIARSLCRRGPPAGRYNPDSTLDRDRLRVTGGWSDPSLTTTCSSAVSRTPMDRPPFSAHPPPVSNGEFESLRSPLFCRKPWDGEALADVSCYLPRYASSLRSREIAKVAPAGDFLIHDVGVGETAHGATDRVDILPAVNGCLLPISQYRRDPASQPLTRTIAMYRCSVNSPPPARWWSGTRVMANSTVFARLGTNTGEDTAR